MQTSDTLCEPFFTYNNHMTMLPVSSYYLVQPIFCHFPTVHIHKLFSSTCYSFHYPPLLPIVLPAQCILPTVPCTTGGPNFPGIPRVSRISWTVQSCLSCNQAKAECLHNTTSNTFTCTADTSECEVQVCEPCNTVYECLNFTLCFNLPAHSKC